jgi:hypothetical protein
VSLRLVPRSQQRLQPCVACVPEGGGVVSGDGFGSQWEQDQTELGGTRAAATIQNENTNSPVDNFREITSRDPATQDTDRRDS